MWEIDHPDAPRSLGRQPARRARELALVPALDGGSFAGLRFSPDGRRVSFATADHKTVRVLDVTTDPPTTAAEIPLPGELVTLEWHPSAPVLALIVAGPKPAVVLWDLAEGKLLATCDGPPPATDIGMVSLGFSPDGRWLAVAGGRDPTVRVFGGLDGAERFRLADTTPLGVHQVFWTPAGELAVAGLMDKLRFWKPDPDPAADRLYRLWPAGRPAFSPDGRWLAVFAPTAGARPVPALAALAARAVDRPKLDRVAVADRRTGAWPAGCPGRTPRTAGCSSPRTAGSCCWSNATRSSSGTPPPGPRSSAGPFRRRPAGSGLPAFTCPTADRPGCCPWTARRRRTA